MLQDSKGFLWFGTEDGLNLYDGYGFTVLRNDPSDEHSLSYNQVNVVYEDRSGVIWVGTFNGGLNRYVLKKNQFVRYRFSPTDTTTLSSDLINCLVEDRSGSLWIGTEFGLNRMMPGSKLGDPPVFGRYLHSPANPHSISDNAVRTLCLDSSGTLWIGTQNGLTSLAEDEAHQQTPRFTRYLNDPRNLKSLSDNSVRSLYVDHSGTLWVGTDNGLNRLVPGNGDAESASFRRYVNVPGNPKSLSNNEIYALLEDNSGMLWVGTDGGGLNRFDPTTETFTRYLNDMRDPNSLSYNEIRSIYQDRSGILWVGTYGGGVNKLDLGRKQFHHYKPDPNNPNSLNQEIVWCIYEDSTGILWIGTHGGGLNKFDRKNNRFTHYRAIPSDPSTLSSDIVRLVIGDPSGDLWIGTHGGGICRFNPRTERFIRYRYDPRDSTSLSHDDIRALYLDENRVLWIGTQGGGLDRLDTKSLDRTRSRFVRYLPIPGDSASLSSRFIRAIYEDRSGMFWIGTQGGGLTRFDRQTGTFAQFRADPTKLYRVGNDFVFTIHEDKEGILWLGTWGGGLNRFDQTTGKFTYFTHKDGLPSDAIYGILEDSRGHLWFSSNMGLSRFDPRTGHIKNYNVRDGLQSNEFNGGSFFKSPSGEMFFGGINGFNAFFPEQIRDNPFIPPIVITSFRKLNKEVKFDRPISEVEEITLSHRDYFFSFEFAALDYTVPEKNQYAYKMEGLDDDWITTSSSKRFAQYTTLRPGSYTFRVKGSNNDGVWNEAGASVRIIITPPFWETWWFRIVAVVGLAAVAIVWYRRRLKTVEMKAELQAAHNAQMSIMPQADPEVQGFDISGVCIPANEVGGDFFDYIWMDQEHRRLGIVIGDVSGKAMKAAMTAVMASGIINAEARNGSTVAQILAKANRLLYPKTERQMFTALCLLAIDINNKQMVFSNAGLIKPLLKSNHSFASLETSGSPHALGMLRDHEYHERTVGLKSGDVLILQTDGIPEAQDHTRHFYEEERLQLLLDSLDTTMLSARVIRDAIIRDVQDFSGTAPQHDDMTVIVAKVL